MDIGRCSIQLRGHVATLSQRLTRHRFRRPCGRVFTMVMFVSCSVIFEASCTQPAKEQALDNVHAGALFEAPKEGFVVDLAKSEEISSKMVKQFNSSVLEGLRTLNADQVGAALQDTFVGQWPRPQDERVHEATKLQVYRLKNAKALGSIDKSEFLSRLRALFAELSGVERAGYHVYQSYALIGQPSQVLQKAHFNLAGVMREDSARFELKADLVVRFSDRTPRAKIVAIGVEKWERSVSFLDRFSDESASTGFQMIESEINHQNWQSAIDERSVITVGGLSIIDFNHDDYWDVLVPRNGVGTFLYLNDGEGGFTLRTIKGLSEAENTGKVLLWADLDADGKDEFINTRVFQSTQKTKSQMNAAFGYFSVSRFAAKRKPNHLQFILPSGIQKPQYEGIVPCDVNHDQKVDLLFLGYKHQDSKPEQNYTQAEDGLRNLLFINHGDGFREEGRERGFVHTQYSFVAACFDFDNDGDDDLFIGNDYGSNRYLSNDGKGYFTEDTTHPFHKGASFSMGVSIADAHNVGQNMMSVANMYSHAGNRIVTLAQELKEERQQSLLRMAQGNALYVQQADGTWLDQGKRFALEDAGWAWGNIFFDVDNDTDKDLIVVNGYTSHSDPKAPDY